MAQAAVLRAAAGDVSDPKTVARMFDAAEAAGRLRAGGRIVNFSTSVLGLHLENFRRLRPDQEAIGEGKSAALRS